MRRARVGVRDVIRDAETLLPGEPVDDGIDPRWQAIIRVGDYIETEPEPVWNFIRKWGGHSQADLRTAVATCLLEHLLEHHFDAYFLQVEEAALVDPLFGDTFQQCWAFGQAKEAGNKDRFLLLKERLRQRNSRLAISTNTPCF
jgi:hypothetical protein